MDNGEEYFRACCKKAFSGRFGIAMSITTVLFLFAPFSRFIAPEEAAFFMTWGPLICTGFFFFVLVAVSLVRSPWLVHCDEERRVKQIYDRKIQEIEHACERLQHERDQAVSAANKEVFVHDSSCGGKVIYHRKSGNLSISHCTGVVNHFSGPNLLEMLKTDPKLRELLSNTADDFFTLEVR